MRWYLTGVFITSLAWSQPGSALVVADVPELQRFVSEMVAMHRMSRSDLVRLFGEVQIRDDILAAIERPAERLPWHQYHKRFVNTRAARNGAVYWKKHAAVLARAEQVYGVPPEVIVAIIGVETRYGKNKGHFSVLEALTTLMLDYPRRSPFFRSELEAFLLLARDEGLDPLAVKGSYAGAMGEPQFIASSYRRYAIDFDGDARRDLLNNSADSIGSVANYLQQHGWRAGEPVVSRVKVNGSGFHMLVATDSEPEIPIARFRRHGVVPATHVANEQLAALLELQDRRGPIYRLGFHNFHVITRYNHSVHYAMAVYELSKLVKKYYRGARR